jgi:Asp-tRNA(Asn)/Glu-tRNA(Gln) amidotransferase A subunit family amidase
MRAAPPRCGGLPGGIQIVGRFGRDRAALEAALFVELAIRRKLGP